MQQQELAAEAFRGDGISAPELDAGLVSDKSAGTIEVTLPAEQGDPDVFEWSEFEVDSDGLIVTWVAESGPLSERLCTETDSARAGGAKVTLASAYRTNDGDLTVILDVLAIKSDVVTDFEASLVGIDNRTWVSTGWAGADEIRKGHRCLRRVRL